MVQRLLPHLGSLDKDLQIALGLLLTMYSLGAFGRSEYSLSSSRVKLVVTRGSSSTKGSLLEKSIAIAYPFTMFFSAIRITCSSGCPSTSTPFSATLISA